MTTPPHPTQVLLMLQNTCNAKCHMCGFSYASSSNIETINLAKFVQMTNNLEMERVENIAYSGGGDPLLCPDLAKIVAYTQVHYPWVNKNIYTNGIALSTQQARLLLQNNFSNISISLHATTAKTYKRITGVPRFEQVLANLEQLHTLKKELQAPSTIQFVFVASKLNIDELPAFVKLAARYGATQVAVSYCRFYSAKFHPNSLHTVATLNPKHSLFYDQERSDQKILAAQAIAEQMGLTFACEPLFSSKLIPKECNFPWQTILVGPMGHIYPCGGGEVLFHRPITNKELYFGNLLEQKTSEYWTNDDYKKLRESCPTLAVNRQIKQCANCNHTMRSLGPRASASHFIQV